MSTPTVPVTVTLAAQDGTPYEGVTVRARLDGNEVYQGIVISDQAEAVTDATGVAVLDLFPNAPSPTGLGTQGTTYRFLAAIPGGRSLNVEARVPNVACRLENILVGDEVGALSDAELALLQAQQATTTAAASAASAADDAVQTAADRVQTGLDRVATGEDRAAAAASAAAAAGDASTAQSASAEAQAAVPPVQVADYTALRAYNGNATNLIVTGYVVSAAPSGIAGQFTRDDSDTTSADNGGTIIVASNGKRWKRVMGGEVYPEWFGAKRDGSTDDYTPLVNAITFAFNTDRTVLLGGGIYETSDELDFSAFYGVRIIGQGCNFDGTDAYPSSVIRCTASNRPILSVWGPVVLRDFALAYSTQQTTADTASIGLAFNKLSGAEVRNIRAFKANTSFGIPQVGFSGTGNWIYDSVIENLISDQASECHYDFRCYNSGGTNVRVGPLHVNGGGTLDFATAGQSCSYAIRGLGWQGWELGAISIDGTIINTAVVDLFNCVFSWQTLRTEACTIKSDADGWFKLTGGYQIGKLDVFDIKNTRWSPAAPTSMYLYRTAATITQFEVGKTRIQSDCDFGATGSRRALTNSAVESGTGYSNHIKIGPISDEGGKLSDTIWTDSISTLLTPVREFNGTVVNGFARAGRSSTTKRIVYATAVPTTGTWAFGDIVRILGAAYGAPHEYICSAAGTPGTWRPSAQTVMSSTTANRPVLRADDRGVMYMDTTLVASGKPIWWNGIAWVDATGATV